MRGRTPAVGSRWFAAMASIPAGKWLKRAREGAAEVRGEAGELGREGFAAGRRGTASATSSALSAWLVVHASSNEKERRLAGKLPGRPRGEERRRGAIADAWRRSPAATAAVRRRASTVDEQEKHSEAQ